MKFSTHFLFILAFVTFGSSGAIVHRAAAQDNASSLAEAQVAAMNKGWWKYLRISPAATTRVKETFVAAPVEVTFGTLEPGKLACVENLWTPEKKSLSTPDGLLHNQSQIDLFDLGDSTTKGVAATIYQATATQPKKSMMWFLSTLSASSFSPDGRYLSLGFDLAGDSLPFFLDTQTGRFSTIVTSLEDNATPVNAAIYWSPDNQHLACFASEPNPSGSAEALGIFASTDRPIRAYIVDRRSMVKIDAVDAPGVVDPLTWLNAQTLIYGSLPQDKGFDLYDITKPGKLARPNIYGFDWAKNSTKLLIRDGYRPAPSPDGSLIAFYGSRDPKKPQPLRVEKSSPVWLWRYLCNGASLCVAKADGSGRIAFQPYSGVYPLIQWLPDNNRFVTIEQTKGAPNYEAQVTLWNVKTQGFRKLATLRATNAKDQSNDGFPQLDFPFSAMGVSADGNKVYTNSISYPIDRIAHLSSGASTQVLQSIDVESGQVSTIATVKNAYMAWTPAKTAAP